MLGKSDQILFGLVPSNIAGIAMIIETVLVEHLCVLVYQQDVAWRIGQIVFTFQLVESGEKFAFVVNSSYHLF